VRFIVVAEAAGKGFRLSRKTDDDEEFTFTCTMRVLSVEAGELA
jgi:hypothetical protein